MVIVVRFPSANTALPPQILYKLQGWDGDVWFSLLVNALLMQTYLSLNAFIGASVGSLELGIGVAGFVSVLSMVFSGVMTMYPNIPGYLRFIYWASPMT